MALRTATKAILRSSRSLVLASARCLARSVWRVVRPCKYAKPAASALPARVKNPVTAAADNEPPRFSVSIARAADRACALTAALAWGCIGGWRRLARQAHLSRADAPVGRR